MVIAIDFDGTLCSDEFPAIGRPNMRYIWFAKMAKRRGARLVLWTCRTGQRLKEAVTWCEWRGLSFDAVNDNLPDNFDKYGYSRKVCADYYLDDKNLGSPPTIAMLVRVLHEIRKEEHTKEEDTE
jgi:hypothetical protein